MINWFRFSVGASTADLKTGNPTIQINSGTASFSVPQVGNIGIGDCVTYNGSQKCFIRTRINESLWTVGLATTGTIIYDSGIVNSIKRCFNSIDDAVGSSGGVPYRTGVFGSNFLNTKNLNSIDSYVIITPYNDNNIPDTKPVVIRGITGDSYHNISITPPRNDQGQVVLDYRLNQLANFSQRTWDGYPKNCFTMNISAAPGVSAAIYNKTGSIFVSGILFTGNVDCAIKTDMRNTALASASGHNIRVRHCIIANTGRYGIVIENSSTGSQFVQNYSIWNCIFYGQSVYNAQFISGYQRGFVYQSIFDKRFGSATGVYVSGYPRRMDMGYNVFFGNPLLSQFAGSTAWNGYNYVFNLGQKSPLLNPSLNPWQFDPVMQSTNGYLTHSYTALFYDPDNHNYIPLPDKEGFVSQLYFKGNWDKNNGWFSDAAGQVQVSDIIGNNRIQPMLSIGAFEALYMSGSNNTNSFSNFGKPHGFGLVLDLVQPANNIIRSQGLLDHGITNANFQDSTSGYIIGSHSLTGKHLRTWDNFGPTGSSNTFSFTRRFEQIKYIDYILNPFFNTRQQFYPTYSNHIDGVFIKPCIHDINTVSQVRVSPSGRRYKTNDDTTSVTSSINFRKIRHVAKYTDLKFFDKGIESQISVVPKRKTQIQISNITQLQEQYNTRTTGRKSFSMQLKGYDTGSSTYRFKRRTDDSVGTTATNSVLNMLIKLKESDSKKIVQSSDKILKLSFNAVQDMYTNSLSQDNVSQYNNLKKQFNFIDFFIYPKRTNNYDYVVKKDLLQKQYLFPLTKDGLMLSIYGWSGFDVEARKTFQWTLNIQDLSSGDIIKFQFKFIRQ